MKSTLTDEQKQNLLIDLLRQHMLGELTQGQLLKYLRKQFLGISQGEFADQVGVSRRTLTDIELDKGHSAQTIINKVFEPFGVKSSLAPIEPHVACYLLVGKTPS